MASGKIAEGAELKVPLVEVSNEDAGLVSDDSEHEEIGDDQVEVWDSSSFLEEAFEELGDEAEPNGGDEVCTLEEALRYRKLLRTVGEDEFIRQTLEAGTITAKKLCTAFGVSHPEFLANAPDEAYYRFLGMGIERELMKRLKLPQYNTVNDVVNLLKKSNNIVVITGAGISTSLGIPDFRSKHTGLYSQLAHLGLNDPQEVFDIGQFREDPTIFYSVAKDILPSTKKFSPTHAFIRLLQDKGKLLTNYTQNIDNLEGYAGITKDKLIQCHGSFATATCQKCRHKVNGDVINAEIKAGKIPRCTECTRTSRMRPAGIKRKRGSDHGRSKSKQRPEYEDSTSDGEELIEPGIMKVSYFSYSDMVADYW
jgi:NAD+-dependent protein deacetylase SIR2